MKLRHLFKLLYIINKKKKQRKNLEEFFAFEKKKQRSFYTFPKKAVVKHLPAITVYFLNSYILLRNKELNN
mgnify:FL=1